MRKRPGSYLAARTRAVAPSVRGTVRKPVGSPLRRALCCLPVTFAYVLLWRNLQERQRVAESTDSNCPKATTATASTKQSQLGLSPRTRARCPSELHSDHSPQKGSPRLTTVRGKRRLANEPWKKCARTSRRKEIIRSRASESILTKYTKFNSRLA